MLIYDGTEPSPDEYVATGAKDPFPYPRRIPILLVLELEQRYHIGCHC
jgi:hypothetical protein